MIITPGYCRLRLGAAAIMLALALPGAAWTQGAAALHDPMRPLPQAAAAGPAIEADLAEAALPRLNATIITASSRVAVFGVQHLHIGEHINSWQIKSIEPGLVTLSNGTELRSLRLAPILTAPDKDGR